MSFINLSMEQVALMAEGDYSIARAIERDILRQAREKAKRERKTVEIYHPDGNLVAVVKRG